MGDGNVYVIVPVETIKKAKEGTVGRRRDDVMSKVVNNMIAVGPGTRSDTPADPSEVETAFPIID